MKKKGVIHFILTGGTIDSDYEGTIDTVVPLKHSIIPDFIKRMKLHEKTVFSEVCMKDSRSLNIADRRKIVETIDKSSSDMFIITHGTYTMPDTARYLEANLKRKDVTVVFTGSLVPLSTFSMSDVGFNLGYSIAKIHHLRPGIYVCMNGRVFKPGEVAKLISEGRFVSIFQK